MYVSVIMKTVLFNFSKGWGHEEKMIIATDHKIGGSLILCCQRHLPLIDRCSLTYNWVENR